MAVKNEATAGQQAVAAAVRVGTSSETAGFYVGGELSLEGSKSNFTQSSTSSTASTLSAGNGISLTAGGNTLIQGSHLGAGNFIAIDTGTLDIVASKDTSRTKSSSQSASASIGFDTAGVTGGSVGGAISRDSSKSTTYNNSTLSASNISLKSSGNTRIEGANFNYDKSMNVDVGGDLSVASLQDSHSQKSMGIGVNIGFSNDIDQKATAAKSNGSLAYARTGNTHTTGGVNGYLNKSNYTAVTNQTNLNGEGKLTVNVAGNTHLKAASMEGALGTELTTSTLTTEDLKNKASYQGMSGGIEYSANSNNKGNKSTGGFSPTIGLPQDKQKHSVTQASLAENTKLTITNQAAQTQDVSAISRDTKSSGYTMTEINTEVIGIRADLSHEVATAGFKKVGDLAMENDWQDGSIEKTIAHAVVGATVAAIGNGDALGGAIGATTAEASRPATTDQDEATQKTVSTIVGAIASGGTGASVGLDGEKYNRQLHQKEIKWIEAHAGEFAKSLYGEHPTDEQLADAKARLSQQSLRQVDKAWSLKLGSETDQDAKVFLDKNNANLFAVKDEHEFKDGSTDGENEISDLSQKQFDNLNSFYQTNVNKITSTNPDGTMRNANEAWANEKNIIDAIKEGKISKEDLKNAIKNLPQNMVDGIADIPDTVKNSANYVDAVLPTTNQERLDTLYGSHTDGSVLQANMATSDTISTVGMVTGIGAIGHSVGKAGVKAVDGSVDDALDVKVNPLDDSVDSLDGKPLKIITIDATKYPESAKHIEDAQSNGYPDILTIDRDSSKKNRRDSLQGIPTKKGYDRDEYPPAMFEEGGTGASVRHISPSDNRGSGSCIGHGCQDLDNGDKIIIETSGEK